ncbi:MAG: proteasome subunit alpha [Verrucomicrobia bacterium Tous-C9LFEB]|nr:MAG: proteasome subunit alpha [Verrucomicrobia bacterium Tous-C9LFEB]
MDTRGNGTMPLATVRGDGDFIALLSQSGMWPTATQTGAVNAANPHTPEIVATTVLSFHYKDGVLIAGDRRATAGHTVVYDRADKVIDIDPYTIMAIAGTPATAFEMARVLQHSFQYYRRSQLQPLSLEAKVRALGKLLKDNLGMTLQGIGVVVPILAAMSPNSEPHLYFYDAMGAQFLAADFAVSGSGSPAVRSVLQYLNRWSGKPTTQRDERESIELALQLLDVAAESDTATGGIDRRSQIFPQVKLLTRDGMRTIDQETLVKILG